MNFLEFIKKNKPSLKLRLTSKLKIIAILSTIGCITIATSVYFYYFHQIQPPKQISQDFKFSRPDNRPDKIKGEIVTLKRLRPEYIKDYHKMISVPIVTKPLYYPTHPSLEFIQHRLNRELAREAKGDTFLYMVFDNKENKLVGSVEIREKNPKDPGQFTCWLNDKYWGGGRFQEAVKLITREYFKVKKVPSFNAHVETWNLRSFYALKNAGFKLIDLYYPEGQKSRYILEFYNPNQQTPKE